MATFSSFGKPRFYHGQSETRSGEFRDYTRAGGCSKPIYGIVQPFSLSCRYICNEEQLEGKSGGYNIPVHGIAYSLLTPVMSRSLCGVRLQWAMVHRRSRGSRHGEGLPNKALSRGQENEFSWS